MNVILDHNHHEDLRRSGLSNNTIRLLGGSGTAEEIDKILGFQIGPG